MKRTLSIKVLAGVCLLSAWASGPSDKAALAKKQIALSSEYSLAKESAFYFVLDVPGRKLDLRVRGMILRSWPLQAMRFWGNPEFAGAVELTRKTTLKAPARIIIKPGETEPAPDAKPAEPAAAAPSAAEFELEALELKDMPKRFSLDFDNRLHVTVKGENGGSKGLVRAMGDAWRWYIALPLRSLFSTRQGQRLSELELTFENDKDAQSIYWHFFDGIKGVIF